MHMLTERLLRLDDVDAGPRQELPRYKEIDMLAQPARVESHADAVAALRYCDWLCTAREYCGPPNPRPLPPAEP